MSFNRFKQKEGHNKIIYSMTKILVSNKSIIQTHSKIIQNSIKRKKSMKDCK